jgi:hypothetical protein
VLEYLTRRFKLEKNDLLPPLADNPPFKYVTMSDEQLPVANWFAQKFRFSRDDIYRSDRRNKLYVNCLMHSAIGVAAWMAEKLKMPPEEKKLSSNKAGAIFCVLANRVVVFDVTDTYYRVLYDLCTEYTEYAKHIVADTWIQQLNPRAITLIKSILEPKTTDDDVIAVLSSPPPPPPPKKKRRTATNTKT